MIASLAQGGRSGDMDTIFALNSIAGITSLSLL